MASSRINKFIFKEGKVFLRLKTTAKNLKVKKEGLNYSMDFAAHGAKGNMVSVPVVWIDDSLNDEFINKEALDLGCKEESLVNAITKIKTSWGQQTSVKTPDNKAIYYYLHPHNETYGVKLGPIPKNIEGERFEMDLENLQWG